MKFARKFFQWTAHTGPLGAQPRTDKPRAEVSAASSTGKNPDPMKQQKQEHLIHKERNKVKDSVMFMQKQKSLFQIGKYPKIVNLIW